MVMDYIRVKTRDDNKEIPDGMVLLSRDNNGWVGTNNGWPMVGQPALYPEEEGRAIAAAWNKDKRLEKENKALREMLKPHYSGWRIDDALAEMAASKNKVKSQGEG
jgi:hypothetical protein